MRYVILLLLASCSTLKCYEHLYDPTAKTMCKRHETAKDYCGNRGVKEWNYWYVECN